ncbi:glycerol-3-phosphate dehydrogenase [Helicobacter valdiviensis]|uniref:Glycolate oxidase iron-sulfur subunit n=1 Tax=Helicobacter valdiviensis TaxID=1458358 RepID=A0A2W6MXA6_9HELI|nr:(Fe-S)-binding protein [Helicobacter valdiviensis]PZT49154.1 glycerol-3-phosphate dehydrogenase [Helicobacter valdiviensis]
MAHYENYSYLKTSDACVKCGKCLPDCTIFAIHGDEATSPRGFIDLLGAYERKEIPLDKNAKKIFETCFLCTTCVSVCPNSLPTDTLIENIRFEIAQKYGIAWFKRLFFMLLKHRFLMDFSLKLGAFFSPLLFKKLPDKSSIIPRFSLPFIKKRVFGAMSSKSFLNSHKEEQIFNPNATQRVAIFIGCLGNYNYTQIGTSLLYILEALGINAFIPKKQKCCAAPAYFTGDFKSVDKLIKENVDYFLSFIDSVDAILIPEATCAAMVLEDWEKFMQKDEIYHKKIQKILPKVFMATQWLHHHTNLKEKLDTLEKSELKVTYHDPCHARKVLGVWKEPRELLKNFQLVEMENPNACCGFGGVTMQTENFHLASKVGDKKAKMIEDTKATYVAAECSACRMQLTNSLEQNNVQTLFAHPLELIAKALRGEKK